MLDILFWVAVFAVSLFFLIKSADWFTEGAEVFALTLGISEWVVGLTLVAVGTSLPELFTSFIGAWQGSTELAVDNVVGSNIANIFLIVGLSAVLARGLLIKRDLIDLDLPMLAATQAILILIIWDGRVSFFESVLSIIVVSGYLLYTASIRHGQSTGHKHKKGNLWKLGAVIVGSAVVLMFSARFAVDALLKLSGLFGIGTSILTISALAIGTSLPELVVSISAARKGAYEMSFGNILGSNIFNSAGVIGLTGLFFPLVASPAVLSVGIMFLVAAVALCVVSGISRKIHSWEGFFFLVLYALFIGKLFNLF